MLERINSNVSVEAGRNILNTVLNSPSLTMNTVYVDKMKQFIRSKFLQKSYVESLDSYIPAREIVVPYQKLNTVNIEEIIYANPVSN